jgi:hypothetical protein
MSPLTAGTHSPIASSREKSYCTDGCTPNRLAALKSQVNGTKGPSRHDRAKINQRSSLTSHNGPSSWSQAISGSPQLTAGHPDTPVLIARMLHAGRF